jgi:hypothetical protein
MAEDAFDLTNRFHATEELSVDDTEHEPRSGGKSIQPRDFPYSNLFISKRCLAQKEWGSSYRTANCTFALGLAIFLYLPFRQ